MDCFVCPCFYVKHVKWCLSMCSVVGCMDTSLCFSEIFAKGNNYEFLFAFLKNVAFVTEIGSTLKGKNLLLGEQIPSFKSCPLI